jgi:hypothetical protein
VPKDTLRKSLVNVLGEEGNTLELLVKTTHVGSQPQDTGIIQ